MSEWVLLFELNFYSIQMFQYSDLLRTSCVMKLLFVYDLLILSPTHWKQTLFMLDRPIQVYTGDSIHGNIVLRRNLVWRRHMTVMLHWNINSNTDDCQANISLNIHIHKCAVVFMTFVHFLLTFIGWNKKFPHVEVTGLWRINSKPVKYVHSLPMSCC